MIEASLEVTYEDAYPSLSKAAFARARCIVGNDDDAEELAQEALLRAYRQWSEIADYAAAWVTRVVTNLAINHVRRKHQCSELPANTSTDQSDTQLDIARALDALPLRQRQVVVLRHIADLSAGDTAEALGISVGAVKRHLNRATTALHGLPTLASGYKRNYAFEQKLAEFKKLIAESVIPAPEPLGGWPPPPWDHRCFLNDDGTVDGWAVDEDGCLILDANGERVITGPGFSYVLCKPLPGNRARYTPPVVPAESLTFEVRDALDRATELAMRFGVTWVDQVAVAIALAERLGEPPPFDLYHLRRGYALSIDGPHADARLERLAEREASGWTRPHVAGVRPLEANGSLVDDLRHAAVQASHRGELANCTDVIEAILRPADPPRRFRPLVYSVLRYSHENRYPQPIEYDD